MNAQKVNFCQNLRGLKCLVVLNNPTLRPPLLHPHLKPPPPPKYFSFVKQFVLPPRVEAAFFFYFQVVMSRVHAFLMHVTPAALSVFRLRIFVLWFWMKHLSL